MKNKLNAILFFLVIAIPLSIFQAQEFNATVKVNYDAVRGSNNMVFTTLEKDLSKFINQKKWTTQRYETEERIQCNFSLIITAIEGTNDYVGILQIQSNRPIYNSIYTSPIINIQDKHVKFKYIQNQPFVFNATQANNNLVDIIAYYVQIILGYDADTFSKMGGTFYFKQALQIVNYQQQQGYEGWNSNENNKNRYLLVANLLDPNYQYIRELYYTYHRLGLDIMHENPKNTKQLLYNNLMGLNKYVNRSAFAYSLDVLIDAKDSEWRKIFSDGDIINGNISELKQLLNQLSPSKSNIWKEMK